MRTPVSTCGMFDRFLLLVDAGLHAVVADPVTGAREHRVVDRDDGQRADGVAALARGVHLRDLLVQRAARQLDAERVLGDLARLVADALGAAVLVALVAEDAVMDLAQHLAGGEARVGQREAVSPAQLAIGAGDDAREGARTLHVHEMVGVERLGKLERHPVAIPGVMHVRGDPPLQRVDVGSHRGLLGLRAAGPRRFFPVQQPAAGPRNHHLGVRRRLHARAHMHRGGDESGHERVVGLGRLYVGAPLQERQRPAADEIDLEAKEVVVGSGRRAQRLGVGPDAEQPGHKTADMRRHLDNKVAARDRRERVGDVTVLLPLRPQLGLGPGHLLGEPAVEIPQPRRTVEVREGEARKPEGISGRSLRRHVTPL